MPRGKLKDRDGIYQRKDRPGTWWGSWIDANGKRRQRKFEAHTLTQARDLLQGEKEKADKQRVDGEITPTKDLFKKFAAVFLDYQKRRIAPKPAKGRISRAEYARQKGIVEKHLNGFFGEMRLALISQKNVNAYIDTRIGKVSDGTIIKEINALKRLFNVAIAKGEITKQNPVKGADIPQAPEGRNRYLTPKELGQVMRACPEWLRPIVGLSVSLGTRRGELLHVRWEDVNLEAREIKLKHTKNGRARPAFINELAMQVLRSMEAEERKKDGKRLLFPGLKPGNVSVAFIRACQDAGVEDFSLHDLRHTFASHARMNGVDLHTLQKLLGHSDPRMTDRYANLSQTFLLDAAKRLDGVLSLTPTTDEDSERGSKKEEIEKSNV